MCLNVPKTFEFSLLPFNLWYLPYNLLTDVLGNMTIIFWKDHNTKILFTSFVYVQGEFFLWQTVYLNFLLFIFAFNIGKVGLLLFNIDKGYRTANGLLSLKLGMENIRRPTHHPSIWRLCLETPESMLYLNFFHVWLLIQLLFVLHSVQAKSGYY